MTISPLGTSQAAADFARRPVARRARPHMREFLADSLSPLAVYQRLAALSPRRFLFESVTGGEQVSRFSFLGVAPRQIYRLYEDRLEVAEGEGPSRRLPGEPLGVLRQVLAEVESVPGSIPFTGGFVGFFGFDLFRMIERLPHPPADPFGLPVAILARFDTLVAFDHAQQRVVAIANEIEGEVSEDEAMRQLDQLEELLVAAGGSGAVALPSVRPEAPRELTPSLAGEDYKKAIQRAQEHIRAGDIFQVVLARRFVLPRRIEPLALYRAVRVVNPSPYMVLLESPEVALVGASPEMLVRLRDGQLETRPIAGTRPRGATPREDQALAEELAADPKERAEHVMLVDLGRNDLGRVAEPGSVRLASYMEVERYSHVMHLVTSLNADLDSEHSAPGAAGALDALLACFPAGTVSGAPKIRAVEIIDQLEPERRGPYAGAVGYLSYAGDLDTCITIRTLVVQGNETSVTAGAGIVADSDPAAEERETVNKAAALLAAVGLAEELEAPRQ